MKRLLALIIGLILTACAQAQPTTVTKETPCTVSDDSTYGYALQNAVRVGSQGLLDGPSREQAYLDTLRGPNGESLTYERIEAIPFEDVFVDVYQIAGLEESVTLYIDMYNYTDPKAPVGFTCGSAFALPWP